MTEPNDRLGLRPIFIAAITSINHWSLAEARGAMTLAEFLKQRTNVEVPNFYFTATPGDADRLTIHIGDPDKWGAS